MHVLDESTNIAANLHCLWLSFNWPHGRAISLCILGNFFVSKTKQVPDLTPLTTNFQPTILAKVGCTTFLDITVLEILRC